MTTFRLKLWLDLDDQFSQLQVRSSNLKTLTWRREWGCVTNCYLILLYVAVSNSEWKFLEMHQHIHVNVSFIISATSVVSNNQKHILIKSKFTIVLQKHSCANTSLLRNRLLPLMWGLSICFLPRGPNDSKWWHMTWDSSESRHWIEKSLQALLLPNYFQGKATLDVMK